MKLLNVYLFFEKNHINSSFFFFFAVFFLFHAAVWNFTCFFYEVLNIFVGIMLLLWLTNVLFLLLLLLDGSCIFLLIHLILLIIVVWCILNNMSIWTWFHLSILISIWLMILAWWNSCSFVSIGEILALKFKKINIQLQNLKMTSKCRVLKNLYLPHILPWNIRLRTRKYLLVDLLRLL